jgi:hypothetical protein
MLTAYGGRSAQTALVVLFLGEMPVTTQIKLSEMLEGVATELIKAQQNAQQRGQAVMQFSECQIDCAVTLELEGKAGVTIKVLELGGTIKKTDQNTITVKFSALPDKPIRTLRGRR